MEVARQRLDTFGKLARELSECGVLLEQLGHLQGLTREFGFACLAGECDVFPVMGVGFRKRLVAIGLPGLRKQDKWRGVGGLKAECEIQQNERIRIEPGKAKQVDRDPAADNYGLHDEKSRRAEEAGKGLGFQREPVVAEHPRQMQTGDGVPAAPRRLDDIRFR